MKNYKYLITAVCLLSASSSFAADKYYGNGSKATGNWTADNWYTAASGGSLTTAPGLSDRAYLSSGDQVVFNTSTTVGELFMNTGGSTSVSRLTFDSAVRTLTASTVSLQAVYGAECVLSMSGGTVNTGLFRYIVGAGSSYPATGNITLSTGAGLLNVTGNFTVVRNAGSTTLANFLTNIGGGGEIRVGGNLDISAFNYAGINSTFSIGATSSTFGKVNVTGTANFVGTDLIIDVTAFTGSGTQTLVSAAGGWTNGFDSYAIKTSSGVTSVTLGQTITEGTYSYTLNMSGNNLNLVTAIPEPATAALALGVAGLLLVSRSRAVRRR